MHFYGKSSTFCLMLSTALHKFVANWLLKTFGSRVSMDEHRSTILDYHWSSKNLRDTTDRRWKKAVAANREPFCYWCWYQKPFVGEYAISIWFLITAWRMLQNNYSLGWTKSNSRRAGLLVQVVWLPKYASRFSQTDIWWAYFAA